MKNILNVILKKHYATCRCLLSLMLISSIFMSTKSFSGSAVEGAGSLQLCSSDRDYGTAIGADGQSGLKCYMPKMVFSLNSAGNNKGALGLNDSNSQITGYSNGIVKIIAKKAVKVNGKIDMKNNGIDQLKPGLLSKDSKDAVNGSQLFSTNENVNKNADNISKNTQSIENNYKELSGGIEKAQNDLNKVNSALTENKDSITNLTNNINSGKSGLVRQSETDGSITIAAETHGESVSVNGTQGPRFLRDVKAGVNNNDAVNVSQLNKLLADNQMSVAPSSSKEKSQATKKDSLALGGGAKSTAEGAIAIGAESKAAGERSIALGHEANSSGSDSLALGAGSSAPGQNAVAVGRQASSSGNNSMALGSGAAAPAENAVALGANSVADRDNSVSVGSPGYERQITNVAPGTHDTDAANISQLNSVRSTATSAHGLAQKNTSRINNLENQLSQTNKKIDRGLAASAALTGLFQPYGVGNVNFTAGMGTYGSSVAMAVGSGYRINEHAAVKAGLAYSGGNNVTSNASFNLEW
ncbi:hypothetical protein SODG_003759 [Sodalis praecaptivus]